MSRAVLLLLGVGAAALGATMGSKKDEPKASSYDYAAAIAPLRATAVEKLKQAVNIDPMSDDTVAAEASAAIAAIQTSWKEADLRAIRNRVSAMSVNRNTAGYTNAGNAYADAAQAIEAVAASVEARNIAIAKPLTTKTSGGRGGRVHSPVARSHARLQLHMTRGM